MLINPLTPVSALPPVTPVRPVTPQQTPMTAEALLAMAAAAAAEVTDQLGRIAGQSSAAAATPAAGTSSAAAATTATAATAAAAVAVVPEPEPTPAVLQARAVGAAAAQAAQRQGGLAPLMADLVAARQTQALPTPVRAALDQVLALRAPIDGAVTGQDVKRALDRSGLFLEARLAAGVAPADRPGASRPAAPGAPPPADLKAALLVFRQVVSGWLDATPAPTRPASPTPTAEAPKAAPGAALTAPTVATPTPAGPPPAPATLAPSPGVMTTLQLPVLEPESGAPPTTSSTAPPAVTPSPAGLAQASAPPAPATVSIASAAPPAGAEFVPATPVSTQAALVAMDAPELLVLQAADGSQTPEASGSPNAPPRAQTPPPSPVAARPATASAPPAAPRLALETPLDPPTSALARGAPPARASAEAGSPAATPPPPYRDGPTSAQPAATASLAAGADPRTVAHHLLRETGAALARQELLQIASLPEAGPAAAPGRSVEDKGARWMFDVPFMTPQGAAVAQFEISRDGGGGGAEYEARPAVAVWRARFSLDVEPMGPVHAQIALSGERARVSLWAERPASMARLMAREPMLSTALREAELTPEVAFHAGAPQRAPAAPGKFVDQAS